MLGIFGVCGDRAKPCLGDRGDCACDDFGGHFGWPCCSSCVEVGAAPVVVPVPGVYASPFVLPVPQDNQNWHKRQTGILIHSSRCRNQCAFCIQIIIY